MALRLDAWQHIAAPLAFALAAGTLARLALALRTFGTNDVATWQEFVEAVTEFGSVGIYAAKPGFNHPPLMTAYLWLIGHLAPYAPNGVPFLIRLPAILADVGSSLLVYRLVAHFWNERRALLSACLIAVSPVLIQVSGFHGNTDPVFIFLILLAAERLLLGERAAVAGACLGLAMSIKIVPVLTVPVFFFWLPTWRRRIVFFSATGLVLSLGYAYHLAHAFPYMKANIFQYSGLGGVWGLGQLLPSLWGPVMGTVLKITMTLAIIAATAWLVRGTRDPRADDRARGRLLLQGLGATFLLFFVLTPGFGVQYMSWLVPTGIFLSLPASVAYNVLAGGFLCSLYTHWCAGFPWNVANSQIWRGIEAGVGLGVWGFLVAWLLVAWIKAWRCEREYAV